MMKLDAPERDTPAGPAGPGLLRLPAAALLVVAGVPGAGKTTLLSRLDAPGSLILDPEPIRARWQRLLAPLRAHVVPKDQQLALAHSLPERRP